MRGNAAEQPALACRRALVTGAASGIGYESALALAAQGAAVVLADRNIEGGQAAAQRIRERTPGADVSLEALDLADMGAIRRFAEAQNQRSKALDILINNAGILPPLTRKTTVDGFELKFGINYLGHFALTGLLLPSLLRSPAPRVVSVSSIVQNVGKIDFEDLQAERNYEPQRAYNQAKLACLMFALEFQRRSTAAGSKLISLAAHPGVARTGIGNSRAGQPRKGLHDWLTDLAFNLTMKWFGQSAEQGAWPLLHAATAADVEPGAFYGPDGWFEFSGKPKRVKPSARALNPDDASRLWEISERLTGVSYKL